MRILLLLLCTCLMLAAQADAPVWTFTPLTATTLTVPNNATATVQYVVTNQSSKSHTLILNAIPAVTQITGGAGVCRAVFTLSTKGASCTLTLQVDGSKLTAPINDGPIVCEDGNVNQCYRPSQPDILHITAVDPAPLAMLSVAGSPLTLNVMGPTGDLTITNNSLSITALKIASDFTGTALDGTVTEDASACMVVAPSSSCVLIYTPHSMVVPLTSFPISGTNTNTISAEIEIDAELPSLASVNPSSGPAAGGAGVTLTGSNLTGATDVMFGGVAATSVNVVDSSTVTAVTPAHSIGAVDVIIDTPQGSDTLPDGYTYATTAVGQSADGGTIACLDGGEQDLISAISNNSSGIEWGGFETTTNANSDIDGSSNTSTIVTSLGSNSGSPYAAELCTEYQIDSQGNSPCETGNACYDDWFLPAQSQLNCLYTNRGSIGGFQIAGYWSSTEDSGSLAFSQNFGSGGQSAMSKNTIFNVRCVRGFTP